MLPLSSSWRTVFLQECRVKRHKVLSGSFTLGQAMRAIRVCHELKLLVVLHQFVQQHLSILKMDVIIAGAMDIQQVSREVFSMRKRGSFYIALHVFLRQAHVALLVNVIIG